jgi:DNA repair exonuclease SbcCD ATPase subunit
LNLQFECVKWKNFLSTGDAYTSIQLNRKANTIIIGENGSGKSTILDAICYALFNRPYRRINKPQLVNSVNKKNMLVEIFFKAGSKKIHIKRGQKPAIFEIYIDGELQDQTAANKDYQATLEKNILKMNFKSFTQIVILGSSSFVPFMQLTALNRRDVIEDLLDIRIFTGMNLLLKDKLLENKENLSNNKNTVELLIEKIKLKTKHIESLMKNADDQITLNNEEIKTIQNEIDNMDNEILENENEILHLQKQIINTEDLQILSKEMFEIAMRLTSKERGLSKDLKFFKENETCPTCTQEISPDFRKQIMDEKNDALSKTTQGSEILEEKIQNIQSKLDSMASISTQINMLSIGNDQQVFERGVQCSYIDKLEENNKIADEQKRHLDTDKKLLGNAKRKLSRKEKLHETLIYDKELFDIATELLKDRGIKTQIIKQYIPIINKLVNKYLQSMNFFVNFMLDENFNETIKSRHLDIFSYDSFSEGEKTRIDLALLLTWRVISRYRNSTKTNLLILDEVFDSSLDSDGGDDFMKLIYDIGNDNNVFVISHTHALVDKFYATIKFVKQKNFSRIVG